MTTSEMVLWVLVWLLGSIELGRVAHDATQARTAWAKLALSLLALALWAAAAAVAVRVVMELKRGA